MTKNAHVPYKYKVFRVAKKNRDFSTISATALIYNMLNLKEFLDHMIFYLFSARERAEFIKGSCRLFGPWTATTGGIHRVDLFLRTN